VVKFRWRKKPPLGSRHVETAGRESRRREMLKGNGESPTWKQKVAIEFIRRQSRRRAFRDLKRTWRECKTWLQLFLLKRQPHLFYDSAIAI
jgi:hypothetical protein